MTLTKIAGAAALTALIAGCGANAQQDEASASSQGDAKPRVERMFERFDADKDGRVTLAEAKAKAAQRFARMDADGDGQVTRAERREARKAFRSERRDRRFARLDADGNGTLSLDEMKAGAERRAERRFARLDTDADGGISRDEMQAAPGRRGKGLFGQRRGKGHGEGRRWGKRGPMTLQDLDARVTRMFDRADADKDGVVTLDEAKAMRRHGRPG